MNQAEQLGFRAFANPTRREILHLLAYQDLTIAEVADNFQMTRVAIKKYITMLEEGDLIATRTDGRTRISALNPDGMKRVFDWLCCFDRFWDDRLAILKSEIEKGHEMSETTLRKSIYLKATPEQVWAYLTGPDKLAICFHKPETPRALGEYTMFGTESCDKLMWGDVLVSESFSKLEYTFTIAPLGDATSTVTWTLDEVAGGYRWFAWAYD